MIEFNSVCCQRVPGKLSHCVNLRKKPPIINVWTGIIRIGLGTYKPQIGSREGAIETKV